MKLLFTTLLLIFSYNFLQSQEKEHIKNKYKNQKSLYFSEKGEGIIDFINVDENIIFFTFDACGGKNKGNGYDSSLIGLLIKENVPSTLFISGRWIEKNTALFKSLNKNPIFEIENHGFYHKPLSVSKRSIYGVDATNSISGVFDEIILNENLFKKYINKKPGFFRSGTAYYDDISIKIANDLGYKIIGFNIIGDSGATFSKEQIISACKKIKKGDIIIFHFNRPDGYTFEALKEIIPELKKQGFIFKKLKDYLK